MDKISILTPTFNRSKFLNLYIDNLKCQTYNKELLSVYILDDGKEPFIKDLNAVKEAIAPIKLNYIKIKQKMTIGAKRNKLVKMCNTKIFCFMDDDDIYNDGYIEYAYNELKKNKVGLVGSNQMLFVYPQYNYELTGLNCGERKELIHEATMLMTKKYFNAYGGFQNTSTGEGKNIIYTQDNKNVKNLDIAKIMICVCHKNNTIDKARFLDERNKLYAFYDGPKLPILKDIFENNKAQTK